MFIKIFINYLLLIQLINIVLADETVVETIESKHVDILDDKTTHKHIVSAKLHLERQNGCPEHNIFTPCSCYEVSFDGKSFQNMVSCKSLNSGQIQSAFNNAAHENAAHHLNTTYDILEIRESQSLNLNINDLTKDFKFRTIKIIDSSISNIDENSFESTSQFTKEFVLMDIVFENGLDDGQKLFNAIKKFDNLEGIYIITSNLKEIPQNSFITNGKFGENLKTIRICNSLISRLYDLTFANLNNLQWIDLGDNRINQVTANTFTMINANNEITLKISLRHNRLTTNSIDEGAFSDIKRTADIYLTNNKIDTLKESVWYRLINSEKNILIHLKNNLLICDCRHHWIHHHKKETELHLKDANCQETGDSIFKKNFAICEKAPILDANLDVHKKCCGEIEYKNKPEAGIHETILITENNNHHERERDHYDSERIIEKQVFDKTHHQYDDSKQIREDVIADKHLKTEEVITNQRLVLPNIHSRKILLSPAVVVKKPLKYRRLVTTTNQINHPTVHHTVYAESSVPHLDVVKVNNHF